MWKIAREYFIAYKEIEGRLGWVELESDFIIVAAASLKRLDVVYSEDNRTMLSEKAAKSYNIVYKIRKLRAPEFKSYLSFVKDIRWLP